MPELPEVETIARGLRQRLIDQVVESLDIINTGSFQLDTPSDVAEHLIGSKVTDIVRYGKMLEIQLSSSYSLAIHLKMTGQLVWEGLDQHKDKWAGGHPSESFVHNLPDGSTRVVINFTTGNLYFNDQRMFGWIKLLPTNQVAKLPFMRKLGPEPFPVRNELKQQFLDNLQHHPKTNIKAAILDQSTIAGVGNIYADESLWLAQIHPATQVSSLTDAQKLTLLSAIQTVMQESLDSGGSTMSNYVKADGTRGDYLDLFAHVYSGPGRPLRVCSRCGTKITKTKLAGRGTHFCAVCQVLT